MVIDFVRKTQIKTQSKAKNRAQFKTLLFDKTPIAIPTEYFNYSNVFSAKYAKKLLKYTKINDYTIKLEKSKQPLFGLIYSLGLVELETLKTYIKTNLANSIIWLFKSSTKISIFLNQKPNRSFYFCMDYQSLNNITIKNQYLLLLIGESLD